MSRVVYQIRVSNRIFGYHIMIEINNIKIGRFIRILQIIVS